MENEEVVKCEGYNNEGACRHAVLDVKMTVLRDTNVPVDSWVECGVYSFHVLVSLRFGFHLLGDGPPVVPISS